MQMTLLLRICMGTCVADGIPFVHVLRFLEYSATDVNAKQYYNTYLYVHSLHQEGDGKCIALQIHMKTHRTLTAQVLEHDTRWACT